MGDRDIFRDSSAWHRLTSPSPSDWSPETTRLKHDVTNVFQTLLAAVQELQVTHQELIQIQERREREAVARDQRREEQYAQMVNDLFNPKDGAFVTARAYTDGKLAKLQNLGWLVLGSFLTSTVMLVVQLAIK